MDNETEQTFPPPAPTGDPFIDEIRRLKWEASARFGHDPERMFAHLKELERKHPGGVIHRLPVPKPGQVA